MPGLQNVVTNLAWLIIEYAWGWESYPKSRPDEVQHHYDEPFDDQGLYDYSRNPE